MRRGNRAADPANCAARASDGPEEGRSIDMEMGQERGCS